MQQKIKKLWQKIIPRRIDKTAANFDSWFRQKLGEQLQGGEVYYCLGIVGQNNVPKIGAEFRVFGELKEAENLRKTLQSQNPSITLEIKLVRVFYSVPEV